VFKISQSQSYTWPVEVQVAASGGRFDKHTFDAEFKRLPQSRIEAIMSGEIDNDKVLAREVVVGWKGIISADGQEVPFSASALDDVLESAGVAASITRAWFASFAGAKAKN
jgi:hypothetical protein